MEDFEPFGECAFYDVDVMGKILSPLMICYAGVVIEVLFVREAIRYKKCLKHI